MSNPDNNDKGAHKTVEKVLLVFMFVFFGATFGFFIGEIIGAFALATNSREVPIFRGLALIYGFVFGAVYGGFIGIFFVVNPGAIVPEDATGCAKNGGITGVLLGAGVGIILGAIIGGVYGAVIGSGLLYVVCGYIGSRIGSSIDRLFDELYR